VTRIAVGAVTSTRSPVRSQAGVSQRRCLLGAPSHPSPPTRLLEGGVREPHVSHLDTCSSSGHVTRWPARSRVVPGQDGREISSPRTSTTRRSGSSPPSARFRSRAEVAARGW